MRARTDRVRWDLVSGKPGHETAGHGRNRQNGNRGYLEYLPECSVSERTRIERDGRVRLAMLGVQP